MDVKELGIVILIKLLQSWKAWFSIVFNNDKSDKLILDKALHSSKAE